MKKELKRLKVAENREEPFMKETKTYYTGKEDSRSRYNNWKNSLETQGYKIWESNPKYFRTTSKKKWIRDDSKFGHGRSGFRHGSQFRNGSRSRSKFRNGNESQERPKSNLFKKVELIEQKLEKVDKVEKSIKNSEEMLKKNTINTKYVEEEMLIDIKYVEKTLKI